MYKMSHLMVRNFMSESKAYHVSRWSWGKYPSVTHSISKLLHLFLWLCHLLARTRIAWGMSVQITSVSVILEYVSGIYLLNSVKERTELCPSKVTVVPPCPYTWICLKTSSAWDYSCYWTLHIIYFPIYTYLWQSLFYKVGTVRD
jgi:hypothetical protein